MDQFLDFVIHRVFRQIVFKMSGGVEPAAKLAGGLICVSFRV
jgi:hypothetical protein